MKRFSVRSRVRLAIVMLIAGIVAAWLGLTSESSLGDQVADALQQVASLFTPSTVTVPRSPSREALEDVVPAVKSGAFGVTLGEAIVAHHEPHGEWLETSFGHATEGRWASGSSFVAASNTGDPGPLGTNGHGDGDGGVGTGNSGGSDGVGGGGRTGNAGGGGSSGGGGVGGSGRGTGTPLAQGGATFDDPLLNPSVLTGAADPAPLAAVPEPGTLLLLGSATMVLGAWRARRRSNRRPSPKLPISQD